MQDDEVMDELNDLFTLIPCQIGGYPFFTQYDPRQEDNNEVLLFQLDSQDHILWGDSGVGNFFISKEDLIKILVMFAIIGIVIRCILFA